MQCRRWDSGLQMQKQVCLAILLESSRSATTKSRAVVEASQDPQHTQKRCKLHCPEHQTNDKCELMKAKISVEFGIVVNAGRRRCGRRCHTCGREKGTILSSAGGCTRPHTRCPKLWQNAAVLSQACSNQGYVSSAPCKDVRNSASSSAAAPPACPGRTSCQVCETHHGQHPSLRRDYSDFARPTHPSPCHYSCTGKTVLWVRTSRCLRGKGGQQREHRLNPGMRSPHASCPRCCSRFRPSQMSSAHSVVGAGSAKSRAAIPPGEETRVRKSSTIDKDHKLTHSKTTSYKAGRYKHGDEKTRIITRRRSCTCARRACSRDRNAPLWRYAMRQRTSKKILAVQDSFKMGNSAVATYVSVLFITIEEVSY